MIRGLSKKANQQKLLISLDDSEVRLFHVQINQHDLTLLNCQSSIYSSMASLEEVVSQWRKQNKTKGLDCHWLLSRSLYKTINVVPPKVEDSEIDTALKWLIKDQVEQSLENLLVTHYRPFTHQQENSKLTAVVIDKEFIEKLIEISNSAGVNLVSIKISELASANALSTELEQDKIVGLIDEDKQGLTYNFYNGNQLTFTRHIKGRFFPNLKDNSFTLESDDQDAKVDRFLLETQRTLDYGVSQIFRRPVDWLIIDGLKVEGSNLVQSLEQITELSVTAYQYQVSHSESAENDEDLLKLSLAEIGCLLPETNNKTQSVNLYLPQYQPKPLEFGFKFASSVAAFVLVGLTVYGYIQESEQQTLNSQLASEKILLEKTQTSLNQLNQALAKEHNIDNINQLIIKRQKELIASRKLLAKVSSRPDSKPVSFSKVLIALSKQKADKLWLTNIDLYPDSISLRGLTTKPNSIPIYINNLAKDALLSSQFDDLTIERDKQDDRFVHFFMKNGHYQNAN